MKKFLAIILAAVLLLCLVGCKKEEEANAAGDDEELHGIEELVYNNFVYDVNEEGDYEIEFLPEGVKVSCAKCHASTLVAADSLIGAHEFLNADRLELK